jgi:hypothetical protein
MPLTGITPTSTTLLLLSGVVIAGQTRETAVEHCNLPSYIHVYHWRLPAGIMIE